MFIIGFALSFVSGMLLAFLYLAGILMPMVTNSYQVILGWLLGVFSFIILEYWRESRETAKNNKHFIVIIRRILIETGIAIESKDAKFTAIDIYRENLDNHLTDLKNTLAEVDDNFILNNLDKINAIINDIHNIIDYNFALASKSVEESQEEFTKLLIKLKDKVVKFHKSYRER